MERLTQKNEAGGYYYPECFREDKCGGMGTEKCETCDFSEKICQKLGQYEDTGLTPEQIREMDRLYREKCEELSRRWIPKPYEEQECESGAEISGKQMENSQTACGADTGTSQLR
jgi:hypothetical protein